MSSVPGDEKQSRLILVKLTSHEHTPDNLLDSMLLGISPLSLFDFLTKETHDNK